MTSVLPVRTSPLVTPVSDSSLCYSRLQGIQRQLHSDVSSADRRKQVDGILKQTIRNSLIIFIYFF